MLWLKNRPCRLGCEPLIMVGKQSCFNSTTMWAVMAAVDYAIIALNGCQHNQRSTGAHMLSSIAACFQRPWMHTTEHGHQSMLQQVIVQLRTCCVGTGRRRVRPAMQALIPCLTPCRATFTTPMTLPQFNTLAGTVPNKVCLVQWLQNIQQSRHTDAMQPSDWFGIRETGCPQMPRSLMSGNSHTINCRGGLSPAGLAPCTCWHHQDHKASPPHPTP